MAGNGGVGFRQILIRGVDPGFFNRMAVGLVEFILDISHFNGAREYLLILGIAHLRWASVAPKAYFTYVRRKHRGFRSAVSHMAAPAFPKKLGRVSMDTLGKICRPVSIRCK